MRCKAIPGVADTDTLEKRVCMSVYEGMPVLSMCVLWAKRGRPS